MQRTIHSHIQFVIYSTMYFMLIAHERIPSSKYFQFTFSSYFLFPFFICLSPLSICLNSFSFYLSPFFIWLRPLFILLSHFFICIPPLYIRLSAFFISPCLSPLFISLSLLYLHSLSDSLLSLSINLPSLSIYLFIYPPLSYRDNLNSI